MSSIVSTLSSNFGKSLILGTLLPVTAFVILTWQLLQPLTGKIDLSTLNFINLPVFQSDLLALALIIVLLSALLFFLNTSLIRLYEGYPWKGTWLGRFFIKLHSKQYAHTVSRAKGYRSLLYALGIPDPKLSMRWNKYMQAQKHQFLMHPNDVLPTRLGNIIRSFEEYPYRQYGMDAVSLWPRLSAIINEQYISLLDDVKITFDFMMNISFLSFLLVIVLFFGAVLFPASLNSTKVLVSWGIEVIVFSLFGWVFYVLSLGKATAWGELVKSAFDVYRADLLKRLGYEQNPVSKEEERLLWQLVSAQLAYGDSPVGPYPPYTWGNSASYAFGTPMLAKLELTRGLVPLRGAKFKVVIKVRNIDPAGRKVENILVSDPVPESYVYNWGSAEIQGRKAELLGFNPLQFRINSLEPYAETYITYYLLKI